MSELAEDLAVNALANACARCGTAMNAGSLFCASCGAVASVSPAPTPAAGDELLERLRMATRAELEVVRQIGRGGMARVYLARQLRLQREIAVKVISPDLLSQADMVQRFRREANTIASPAANPLRIPVNIAGSWPGRCQMFGCPRRPPQPSASAPRPR